MINFVMIMMNSINCIIIKHNCPIGNTKDPAVKRGQNAL